MKISQKVRNRAIMVGKTIVVGKYTVRVASRATGVPRSVILEDIDMLKIIDNELYLQVKEVLNNKYKED